MASIIGILIIVSLAIGISFFSKSSENSQNLTNYSQIETQLDGLQLKMMKLKNENKNIIEGLRLSETATTNQDTAAKVLIELAGNAGLNIALTKISFDGNITYNIDLIINC